jgi:hypothetical protein
VKTDGIGDGGDFGPGEQLPIAQKSTRQLGPDCGVILSARAGQPNIVQQGGRRRLVQG